MSTPYDFTELPDDLWAQLEPLLDPFKRKRSGGSAPISSRNIMNGIIFRLKTGCQWSMIPRSYGSKSAIHEHYRRWARRGVFNQLMKICLENYHLQQGLHLSWQSMDGSLIQAPVRTKKKKRTKALERIQQTGDALEQRFICMSTKTGHPSGSLSLEQMFTTVDWLA